jgi:acyl-CoA synthetase (AMP-forming)/AMP-acid ligase II
MNLTEPIRENAAKNPDAIAVVDTTGRGVTYRQLDRAIDSLGHRLRDIGLVPGDLAGVAPLPPYPYHLLRLALARLGVAFGPASLPAARTKLFLIAGAAPRVDPTKAFTLDPAWFEVPADDRAVAAVTPHEDDSALFGVFPSSGTTGSPKLIPVSVATVRRRAETRARDMPLPPDVTQICLVGPGAFLGFSSVLRVLRAGGRVVLPAPGATSAELVATILHQRVNHLVLAPMSLERLAAAVPEGEGPLAPLVAIEVSGSSLPVALYELARRRVCAHIVSGYGGTEMGYVASGPMSALHDVPGAVGFLHPGVQAEAVDESDRPLPPGTEGILRVRTGYAATEYLDNPAATAATFRNGWVYPGDMGAVFPDGLLTVSGRLSEIINSGGNKVNPRDVEDVLVSFPGIREAAAFGVPDSMGVTRVWAAIVSDAPVDSAALYGFCRQRLGNKGPQRVMRLDALPLTDSGKVARAELAQMVAAEYASKIDAS